MLESALRDQLADHLDLLEPGLKCVETEVPLKNKGGSEGRVDTQMDAFTPSTACSWLARTSKAFKAGSMPTSGILVHGWLPEQRQSAWAPGS